MFLGAAPNPTPRVYVRDDANIDLARLSLQEWLQNTHEPALHNLPADVPVEEHEANTTNNLRIWWLLRYLDHIQHCIG